MVFWQLLKTYIDAPLMSGLRVRHGDQSFEQIKGSSFASSTE